jgi:hypothetical protein
MVRKSKTTRTDQLKDDKKTERKEEGKLSKKERDCKSTQKGRKGN